MLNVLKATDKSFAEGKIVQSVSKGVGVITFNNPAKRNAMSLDMWEGLGHALVELRDDLDVRVVIMVGAGDKAFVSGADISQFEKPVTTPRHRKSIRGAAPRSALCWRIIRSRPSPASAAFALAAACRSPCWRISASPPRTASSAFPPPSSASPTVMTG